MGEKQPAPDVKALEDTYKIVGELRGSEGARKYMATRIDDGTEVIISVLSAPRGGENNELSHFAADVQLLSSLSHPGLARVYESRWLNNGALAVVSARVPGKTLAEALKAGEPFSNPRAAVVLQEIWAVMDWARTSGVVHRGVTPDNVYFAPQSQHVCVVLGPTAIPVEGVNDVNGDARTIGELAWAMLTGKPFVAEDADRPLEELAPNLAVRVVDATEAMVHGARVDEQEPDVPTFVGIVAAGDVLKQAEVELSAMKEEYEEQHRVALASCENHRLETEQMAAEQAEMLSTERADFEETMGEHLKELAAVREELQGQMATLDKRMQEFENRRAAIAQLRTDHEAQMQEARRAREQAAADAEAKIASDERDSLRREQTDIRSIIGAPRKVVLPKRPSAKNGRRRWMVPTAALGVLLLGGAAVAGVFYARHKETGEKVRATPVGPVQRSAAGTVVPGAFTPAPAPARPDSLAKPPVTTADTTSAAPRREATPDDTPVAPKRKVVDRPQVDAHDSAPATAPLRDSAQPVDSSAIWARTDSVMRADSARRIQGQRDSMGSDTGVGRNGARPGEHVVRVDTTWLDGGRRDSMRRRDSLSKLNPNPDSTRPRPDSTLRLPPN